MALQHFVAATAPSQESADSPHPKKRKNLVTHPINDVTSSPPRRTFLEDTFSSESESLGIESRGRLWEVEIVLQKRTVRGRGMHAKRARRYKGRPVGCLLGSSIMHERLGRLSKNSQDKHAGKEGALSHHEIRLHWVPSWVSYLELAVTPEVSDASQVSPGLATSPF